MDPDPSGVDDEVDHTAPVRPRPHDDRIGGGVAAPRAVERIHIVVRAVFGGKAACAGVRIIEIDHTPCRHRGDEARRPQSALPRSEEHTSELQSLMRISYAVFCLKKQKTTNT